MKIANWKIGAPLGVSHALLLLLLTGMALCGVQGLVRANGALHHIADVNTQKVLLLEKNGNAGPYRRACDTYYRLAGRFEGGGCGAQKDRRGA